jgi:hypothetical protein
MTRRWFYPVAVMAFCLVPQQGHAATLGPADQYGRVQVASIQTLADSITGGGVPAYCVPTSTEDYGWISSNDDPSTDPDGTTGPNGEDWTVNWAATEINISGDICSQLERLTRYPQTARYFREKHFPKPHPILKGHHPKAAPRYDVTPNFNTYDAAVGILTLAHEALHVRLQSTDEGLVECRAIQNVWPLIAALHLPVWLDKILLLDAKANHFDSPDQYLAVC